MSVFRAAIGFPFDSALPRDVMQITPHFNGDNAQALADALKTNLKNVPAISTTKPFKIKIYDANQLPPSYPIATAEQTGAAPATSAPRELALCLSYYALFNRPSLRGRLYIPFALVGGTPSVRPSGPMMSTVTSFATSVFMSGLPANHHWVVWSRKNREAENVTNWWCDDEWDIIRSRGLRPTTRVLGP